MEENVALDSNKQKQFVKSLKGLKKLMKKSDVKTDKSENKVESVKTEKKEKGAIKQGKIIKKIYKNKGLVYLSHIPHGFYEHEMTQYFKQFGVVTNARVIRSKRTGRSKGHAFVEFKNTDVAQVVAETMNNYLMGKRLIKAVYIPPKDQRKNVRRKNWNDQNNPGSIKKLQMKKAYNSVKTENADIKIAKKLLSNLSNTKSKLKELGIDYDFFMPVDVPEALMDQVKVKQEKDKDVKDEVKEKPEKKEVVKKNKNKASNLNSDTKELNVQQVQISEATKTKGKIEKQGKANKIGEDKSNVNITKKESVLAKVNKKNNSNVLININAHENQQKIKEQNLKNTGVNPLEDFIKISDEQDDDSDSSYQFDSDEYENVIDNEDSDDNVSGDDNKESDEDIAEVKSEEVPQKKKNKGKKNTPQAATVLVNKQNKKPQQQNKRKGIEKVAVQNKKPKFEKQNNKKLLNKQLKKRK